eukprot:RCo035418
MTTSTACLWCNVSFQNTAEFLAHITSPFHLLRAQAILGNQFAAAAAQPDGSVVPLFNFDARRPSGQAQLPDGRLSVKNQMMWNRQRVSQGHTLQATHRDRMVQQARNGLSGSDLAGRVPRHHVVIRRAQRPGSAGVTREDKVPPSSKEDLDRALDSYQQQQQVDA